MELVISLAFFLLLSNYWAHERARRIYVYQVRLRSKESAQTREKQSPIAGTFLISKIHL
jgi:hypothetical protein